MVKETQPLQIKQEFTEKKSFAEVASLSWKSLKVCLLCNFGIFHHDIYPTIHFFLLQTFLSSATYSSSSGGDTKLLADQPRDIISSMCPGSTLGPVL